MRALVRFAGIVTCVVVCLAFIHISSAAEEGKLSEAKHPVAVVKTSEGVIRIELLEDKAPISVKNFIEYAEAGFFDGTVFHRVISNFMIQGGGMTPDLKPKPTNAPIKNEATNGLKNDRGTVAMARTNVVDSATSQFFINVQDNPFLNHRDTSPMGFGYAVFGKVVEGLDVVDRIKSVPTKSMGPHQDVPATPVVIESVKVEK